MLRSFFLAVGLLLCIHLPAHAESALPVPSSYFPAGSWIDFHPSVSNKDMDSWWGHDEGGYPSMHVQTQDLLTRKSGWLESSFHRVGTGYIYFAIFRSEYGSYADGSQGNAVAFADWRFGVSVINGLPLANTQPKNILPPGVDGGGETRILRAADGGPTVAMAVWWGATHEVEALSIYTPGLMALSAARRMLAAQVRYVVRSS